ncbi:down syndrome cell adhesion molecule isoform x69, partial [Lasius niger]
MKCKIPSFVSEFVHVDQWTADDGTIYTPGQEYVVQQFYETRVIDEFVLRGNAATLKCLVPSFVADFVDVIEWQAEDGSMYTANNQQEKDGKYLVLPSGELHIRDVGPEDGYKTYQCRTKHRLTGETRLSATKGRLVIT